MKTTEQVEVFRTEWCEALKSGRFLQAQGVLEGAAIFYHDGAEVPEMMDEDAAPPTGNCCLGVGLVIDPNASINNDADPDHDYNMPSVEWLAEWGITQDDAATLASMNDGDRTVNEPAKTFDQISDYIATMRMEPYEI